MLEKLIENICGRRKQKATRDNLYHTNMIINSLTCYDNKLHVHVQ